MNQLTTRTDIFCLDANGQMIIKPEAALAIREMEKQKKEIDKYCKKVKNLLRDGMEEYGIEKLDSEDVLITYVEESDSTILDQSKIWKDYPDVAFQCQKDSHKSAFVKITVR